MNNLWFPVKLAQVRAACFTALTLAAFGVSSCGYHPAYGGERPEGRLSVAAAPSRAPEAGALAAVLSGLRGELSRAGVLAPGNQYPRVVVELVRVDERGVGQLQMPEAGVPGQVLARGSLVGVTARAWIEEKPQQAIRDTGDVRRTTSYSTVASSTADLATRQAALAMAGAATGTALGRRVLGEIEPTQEPM